MIFDPEFGMQLNILELLEEGNQLKEDRLLVKRQLLHPQIL